MKQFTKIAVVCALAVSLAACGSFFYRRFFCCLFRGCFQRCCFFCGCQRGRFFRGCFRC